MRVVVTCLGMVAGMLALSYASVPLYRLFCQVTGFGGTTQVSDGANTTVLEREVTVLFDANQAPDLPWRFEPVQRSITLKVGERALAFYRATNIGTTPVVGTATFNVTPVKMGGYFMKIQCFCFEEQRLEPGQSIDMPVAFYLDPEMNDWDSLDDVKTVTLSYTFFRDHDAESAVLSMAQ